MIFQGWPISKVPMQPWISDALLYGLAGNAVACPVLLALVMATAVSVSTIATGAVAEAPWTKENENEQSEALRLLVEITT